MQEIRIISDYDKEFVKDIDFLDIKANIKKEFYQKINDLINNNTITKNWALYGSSVLHQWFRS